MVGLATSRVKLITQSGYCKRAIPGPAYQIQAILL